MILSNRNILYLIMNNGINHKIMIFYKNKWLFFTDDIYKYLLSIEILDDEREKKNEEGNNEKLINKKGNNES